MGILLSKRLSTNGLSIHIDEKGIIFQSYDSYKLHTIDPIRALFLSFLHYLSGGRDISTDLIEIAFKCVIAFFGGNPEIYKLKDKILNTTLKKLVRIGKYPRFIAHVASPEKIISGLYNVIDENAYEISLRTLAIDKLNSLLGLVIIPTFKCHLRCLYCYQKTSKINKPIFPERLNGLMKFNIFKKVIDEARDLGLTTVVFTGGEPFLHPRIFDMLKYTYKNDIYTEVSTKFPLKEKDVKKLEGNVDKIQISLDCHIPEIQDKLTQVKGSGEWLLKDIELLSKTNIRLQVNVVVTTYNINYIPDLIEYLYYKGVDVITLSIYGLSITNPNQELRPSRDDYINLAHKIEEKLANFPDTVEDIDYGYISLGDKTILVVSPIYAIRDIFHKKKEDSLLRLGMFNCGAYRSGLAILPDGDVLGCDRMYSLPWYKKLVVGNVKKQSIKEIWYSEKTYQLAKPSRDKFKDTMCFNCELFDYCLSFGFCYLDAYYTSGKMYGPRLNCPKSENYDTLFKKLFGVNC